jgi:hypothetical protein
MLAGASRNGRSKAGKPKMPTAIAPEDRAALRREKARLRSERARRARGIMPRPKAKQPWLAEGISRSTWYRRQKKAREQALAAQAAMDAASGARTARMANDAAAGRSRHRGALSGRRRDDPRRAGRYANAFIHVRGQFIGRFTGVSCQAGRPGARREKRPEPGNVSAMR